jgi:indole-3-glycerol phosphate synthase
VPGDPTYLDDILEFHRARVAEDTRFWQDRVDGARYEGPSFHSALANTHNPNIKVMAEIKRRSPSKGWLDADLDPVSLSRTYQKGGATAISVLTDEPHFSGSLADLIAVREAVSLPLLRKDFILSANDVLDSAEAGAGAVLLIVAALSDEELELFHHVADLCGIDCLVEVHDGPEMNRALNSWASIVGINQRDLHTFEVDHGRAESLVGLLPSEVVVVVESGITSREQVRSAGEVGAHAVLVGEAFIVADNKRALVMELATVTV